MANFPVSGEPGSSEPRSGGTDHQLPPHLAGDREPDLPEPVTAPAYAGAASGYRPGSYPVPGSGPPVGPYPPSGPYSPARPYPAEDGSYPDDGAYPPDEELAAGPRRPVLRLLAIAIPVFLIVTIGVVALLSDRRSGQDPAGGTAVTGDRGEPAFVVPADPRNVTAPLDARAESTFDLITGTNAVTLRVVDLPGELFRISTPAGGNTLPRPTVREDRVQLQLVPSGEDGPGSVDIELNSEVSWQIRITGGAAEQVLDLGSARLTGVELLGGSTRTELTLPPPDGTLTVRMTGGINQFVVNAPEGPPVRVSAGKGAASVTVDGDRDSGVAPGRVFLQPGWDSATDRYDIDMVVGVATLTVQRQ